MRQMIPVVRALFISFVVHILFMMGMAVFIPEPPQKPEVAEIEIIEPKAAKNSKQPSQQIVRQAFVPDKLKAPDDDELARFLSEQKQRVKKESKAALSGMTENSDNKPKQEQKQETRREQPQQQAKTPPPPEKDGYREVDISKEMADMNRLNGMGPSRTGESLPTDVSVGSFTALNTDRYTYYTFYARIEELVRYRWETQVGRAIDSFDRATMLQASDRNWVTQVEFLLDARGELKQAIIMKNSGIKKFDLAAVNAFKEARIFPNPPKELVEDDGFIHLKYSFNVNYRPPAMAIR